MVAGAVSIISLTFCKLEAMNKFFSPFVDATGESEFCLLEQREISGRTQTIIITNTNTNTIISINSHQSSARAVLWFNEVSPWCGTGDVANETVEDDEVDPAVEVVSEAEVEADSEVVVELESEVVVEIDSGVVVELESELVVEVDDSVVVSVCVEEDC